jgi:hypothetical protein
VFVTYSLCFMTLFTIVLTLLGLAGASAGWLMLAAFTLSPIHMYLQLKGAYRLRRRSALARSLALLVLTTIPAALFCLLLLSLGVLG